MYTYSSQNRDMLLDESIVCGPDPRRTNLNNINSHSVVSISEELVQANDAVKQQPNTHYEKGIFQFDNRFSNIGHRNCSNVIKYPRVFRPIILQQHPDYSTQILPQPYDTTLLSEEPFISNDENKQLHPDLFCSYADQNKSNNYEKYDKCISQLQFPILESARMHHRLFSHPDLEVANRFHPLNNFMEHTNVDFSYLPENNQQIVNKPEKWLPFENDRFNMANTDIDHYRKTAAHKELSPNWLATTKVVSKFPDKTDKIQQYHDVLINSKGPSVFNQWNCLNYPSNYATSSKTLERSMFKFENSFNNFPNSFNNNSNQSVVLSNVNDFNLYCSSLPDKIVTNKLMCPYCNIYNSSPAQLKIHLRIHTGERPYVCDILGCDKTFTRNEELTRHLKIHSGDRPYICKICKRSFGRKDHLTKHEVTHRSTSDKKVHLCLVAGCKQKYTRSDALARHRWNVHFIRPQVKKKLFARKTDQQNMNLY